MGLTINNREIIVVRYGAGQNWDQDIPHKNWVCVLMDNDSPEARVKEAISKILDRDVCYVCTTGANCEETCNLLEHEITCREVDLGDLHLPEHFVITARHKDFNQGVLFAIFDAGNDDVSSIDKVVILDMSGGKVEG